MKQVLQHLRTGQVEVADVPCPAARAGHLLIQTTRTLVSAGTERMLVEFGKAGLIAKARSQPEKVRQVLDKIKTDGLLPTLEAVFARLDEPLPLGYCHAGVIVEVGEGVEGYAAGDRVISNGPHAEMACCPINLCAKIPDGVGDDHAAFTVLGAIGLQGVRLLAPALGERVAVIGLGLIGLMAVQMLRAAGCRVLGIDLDPRKCELARRFGAETANPSSGADPVAAATAFSDGRGVDGVLITASAKTNDIVHQAAQMCRKRGRIVLVGVVGLELRRSDFYEKELTFQVSCSYGPGRYDSDYEQRGRDYPYAFVRWTEQRNFQAVLEMMADGRLLIEPLIERRVPLDNAPELYSHLTEDKAALGLLLEYPNVAPPTQRTVAVQESGVRSQGSEVRGQGASNAQFAISNSQLPAPGAGRAVVGVIGAGNFTKLVLMPALAKTGARLRTVASQGGVTAAHLGRKFGFEQVTTDARTVLADPAINTVIITTRHDAHARMTIDALDAGKHVFVEKPLALTEAELQSVEAAYRRAGGRLLMVGFNRRFAPHVERIVACLRGRTGPLCMVMTVNAGALPADHWTHDSKVGGGRIIGEGCHWIDLLRHLAGAAITDVSATTVGPVPGMAHVDDKTSITLRFADGSLGTIHYFANGSKAFPKERLDVFWDGKVLQLDNYRVLRGFGTPGFKRLRTFRPDKGHAAEIAAFIRRVAEGGPPLIPFDELLEVTRASFRAAGRVESA